MSKFNLMILITNMLLPIIMIPLIQTTNNLILGNFFVFTIIFTFHVIGFVSTLFKENSNEIKIVLSLYIANLIVILYLLPILLYNEPRFLPSVKYYEATKFSIINSTIYPDQVWLYRFPGAFVLLGTILPRIFFFNSGLTLTVYPLLSISVISSLVFINLHKIFTNQNFKISILGSWISVCVNWIDQTYFSSQSIGYIMFLMSIYLIYKLNKFNLPEDLRDPKFLTLMTIIILFLLSILLVHLLSFIMSFVFLIASQTQKYIQHVLKYRKPILLLFALSILIILLLPLFIVESENWFLQRFLNQINIGTTSLNINLKNRYYAVLSQSEYSLFIFIFRLVFSFISLASAFIILFFKFKSKIFTKRIFINLQEDDMRKNPVFLILTTLTLFVGVALLISYGGEIFLRVLMFSSMFISFSIADKIYEITSQFKMRIIIVGFICILLIFSHGISRFGEEENRVFESDEIEYIEDILLTYQNSKILMVGGLNSHDYEWTPNVNWLLFSQVTWNEFYLQPTSVNIQIFSYDLQIVIFNSFNHIISEEYSNLTYQIDEHLRSSILYLESVHHHNGNYYFLMRV